MARRSFGGFVVVLYYIELKALHVCIWEVVQCRIPFLWEMRLDRTECLYEARGII
jgi:hypothetical protein